VRAPGGAASSGSGAEARGGTGRLRGGAGRSQTSYRGGSSAAPGELHCACADRRKMADSAELKAGEELRASVEGAWPRRAVGPGCLGGADGSSPACYCCGRLWRGWRGEERVSRDVAAAAVPEALVPYLAARLPAPPHGQPGAGGVGCAWKGGDWENCPAAASSSSFAVPGSCQALRSDPRELGSGRPAPPWRPGAPAPFTAAARLSVGAGPLGKRDLGAIDWGHRGEALGKFSELGAGVGGSAKRLQGDNLGLPGGTLLFLSWFRATGVGGGITPWKSVHLGAVEGMQPPLYSCCRWCGG
ncbi:hypothetical protein LEMLEM_LOCUS22750, partial [Lemmus lemmus]